VKRRKKNTSEEHLWAKAADLETRARELFSRLGLPETTPESHRDLLRGRQQLEARFLREISDYPGAPEALEELQRHHLPGGDLLHYLARLSVEVHIHWRPSETGIRLPGTISFPSAVGARRADLYSRRVRAFARDLRQFQGKTLPPEFVLGLSGWKADSERNSFSENVRSLPSTLEDYADFLGAMAAWLRPRRGRRSRPALDDLTRILVKRVLGTLDENVVSRYGVLKPLSLLVSAAYKVAGAPKRFTPDTLRRLLQKIQT
jgi:hypothetical protein